MATSVLIVDDEKAIRESIQTVLSDEGYITDTASDGNEALSKIKETNYDVVITDIKMPNMDGMGLLKQATQISPETFFIIMTAYASVKTAISAIREGAYDYLMKPIEFDDLLLRLKRLSKFKKLSIENKSLRQRVSAEPGYQNIIGESNAIKKVFNLITQVSKTKSNVLITGKSGTGKELVAKAIHHNSNRKNEIFLPINCGAISENLIESELFGHKKGSFTGAVDEKIGLFKVADGGTLFLDEIGDLPLNMQVKLLRAIEDKKFIPVGGIKPISTDVRIIAATNQNLFTKSEAGEFREDLYYRLNVIEISLPSLNERRDDIPLLVNYFVAKYCNEMGKKILGVDNEAMKALMNHNWRGGVRELENVIERAVIFSMEDIIKMENLSDYIKENVSNYGFPVSLKEAVKNFEREHIINVIKNNNYNKEETAKALEIGLSSLYRKMEELNIPTKFNENDF
ncbi:MAG: sigma-54 dependent transcriptional regulator [Melioribacteraceae bacterium]|jgi:DNA-binding NtrC family response regulator|nr:sigma-54 dependent transcriptional regulator [Melioribacteraceae bacterium]